MSDEGQAATAAPTAPATTAVVPVAGAQPGTRACPRCAASVARSQDWCLSCGAAARTVLAPTPNWRLPTTVLATLAAAAVLALIAAFVVATNDDEPLVRTAPSAPVTPPTP